MNTFVKTFHLKSYPKVLPTRPELSVAGKSVLITGGGYGIGRSIAEAFATAGAARIAITGRTESRLKATAAELTTQYPKTEFSYFAADIRDAAAIKAVFGSFGSPDVLVNNAGFLSKPERLVDADLKSWWESFEINVLGTATVIQAFLASKAAGKAANVITVNTAVAHYGRFPTISAYGSSKAALLRLTEFVQVEAPEVSFVSVHPGVVETDMSSKSGLKGMAFTDADLSANFIVWLASAEAAFLKGRYALVNWDVEELIAKAAEIVEKDQLLITMNGL